MLSDTSIKTFINPAKDDDLAQQGYKFVRIESYSDAKLVDVREHTLKPEQVLNWTVRMYCEIFVKLHLG